MNNNEISMTKRVFARQISRQLEQNEIKQVSGGADLKGGLYVTNTQKFVGIDCCKPR